MFPLAFWVSFIFDLSIFGVNGNAKKESVGLELDVNLKHHLSHPTGFAKKNIAVWTSVVKHLKTGHTPGDATQTPGK